MSNYLIIILGMILINEVAHTSDLTSDGTQVIDKKEFNSFENESEVSTLVSGGNSNLKTYNFKSQSTFHLNQSNSIIGSGHYLMGEAAGVQVKKNWDGLFRYERILSEKFELFISEQAEGDRFKGLKQRYNSDLGFKHYFWDKTRSRLQLDMGLRYQIEKAYDSSEQNAILARFYLEFERELRQDFSLSFISEIIIDPSSVENMRLRMGPYTYFSLASYLSLKIGYEGTYDNRPLVQGSKKFDYLYTTSLLAKF